jgi:hypothetical protein
MCRGFFRTIEPKKTDKPVKLANGLSCRECQTVFYFFFCSKNASASLAAMTP